MGDIPLLNNIPAATTEEDVRKIIAQVFGFTMTPTPQGMVIQIGKGPYCMETLVIPPDIMTQGSKAWALFLKSQADQAALVGRVLADKKKP